MKKTVRIGDELYEKCGRCGILRNAEVSGPCTVCKDGKKRRRAGGYHNASAAKSEMVSMRAQGYTYGEIGERFGLSRQRVHQIVGGRSPAY